MKIIDNNEEKKKSNKVPIIVGCVVVCVVAVVALVMSLNHKNDDITEVYSSEIEESVAMETPTPVPTETPTPVPEKEPEIDLMEMINYTSIETDDESLIQLVKDTITSANLQLEDAVENGELDRTGRLLRAIENANENNGLNEVYAPLEGENTPLTEDKQNWTFMDAAGAIGYLIFNEKDLERGSLSENDLLKHFVAEGVYHFDVESLNDFQIEPTMDLMFTDCLTGDYDVNFIISFDNEGTIWVALVGNVNSEYRVLDMVEKDEMSDVASNKAAEEGPKQAATTTPEGGSGTVKENDVPTNDIPQETTGNSDSDIDILRRAGINVTYGDGSGGIRILTAWTHGRTAYLTRTEIVPYMNTTEICKC